MPRNHHAFDRKPPEIGYQRSESLIARQEWLRRFVAWKPTGTGMIAGQILPR
jgi:hypothetical protein